MFQKRKMIELFTIFGKGGIVLWCFQEGSQLYRDTINQFIKEVLMQVCFFFYFREINRSVLMLNVAISNKRLAIRKIIFILFYPNLNLSQFILT